MNCNCEYCESLKRRAREAAFKAWSIGAPTFGIIIVLTCIVGGLK